MEKMLIAAVCLSSVEFRVSYFLPTAKILRDVYGMEGLTQAKPRSASA
ncbi:MAG: hypothetical protein V4489_02105 [Chlamydiota bacterium]